MTRFLIAAACLFLSACAAHIPQRSFEQVSRNFEARTGSLLQSPEVTSDPSIPTQEISKLLSQELDLKSVTRIALLSNQELQATFQGLGIAQAELLQAGLLPNPFLDAELRFPSAGSVIDLGLVQNIVGILEIPLRRRVAEARVEEVALQLVEAALKLTFEVRSAFFRYQAAQQLLELKRTSLLALDASKELAEKLYAAGNISDLQLLAIQSQAESFRIEALRQEQLVFERREKLNLLLGLSTEQLAWTAARQMPQQSDFLSTLLAEDPPRIERRVLESSLELAQARQRIQNKQSSLGLSEKFGSFEELQLGLSAERESEGDWSFGPALAIALPFFDRGQAKVLRATAELRQEI
jgi:cobalt-zinc-cadmium efflux system outer membrane protein